MSWEPEAENWLLWARTPGHDAYWHYRDSFFSAIVPPAGRLTLEVRSGEGRVARDLAERGHRVVGIDTSPTLVRHAAEADDRGRYLVAAAEALPFAAASFDLVVAYNALMDVDDLEASVREAARVLEPGGRLSVSVTHPFADAGRFVDDEFVVGGAYLERSRFEGTDERSGLVMNWRDGTIRSATTRGPWKPRACSWSPCASRRPRPCTSAGGGSRCSCSSGR